MPQKKANKNGSSTIDNNSISSSKDQIVENKHSKIIHHNTNRAMQEFQSKFKEF